MSQLEAGTLVSVCPTLVKRGRKHFDTLPNGVFVVFANNGFVWVGAPSLEVPSGDEAEERVRCCVELTNVLCEAIVRTANAITALDKASRILGTLISQAFVLIHPRSIETALSVCADDFT